MENTIPMATVDSYQQQPMSLPATTNVTSQIDQEFTQINQQFQDLSLQYQNQSYEYSNSTLDTSPNQSTELNSMNNYADQTNQYAQHNVYEPQQQSDFHRQTQQTQMTAYDQQQIPQTVYSEQQVPQMYHQSPGYNDPMSYSDQSYENTEVKAFSFSF